jgi:outer membrane lipoprotein-sorting protein
MVASRFFAALATITMTVVAAKAIPSLDQTLRAVFQRSTKVPFEQVQFLYSPNSTHKPIQIKLESDGRGTWKHTILQPLILARTVSVDDGKTWTTYSADRRTISKTESPRLSSREVQRRLALLKANYTTEISYGEEIADRRTLLVVATPKSSEMPIRRMWIDPQTNILLRSAQTVGGKTFRLLDTVIFATGDEATPDTDIEYDTSDWREQSDQLGRTIQSPREAHGTMGRTLRLPTNWPMGFTPVKMIVIPSETMPMLSVRLSDGLSTATLYWFRRSGQSSSFSVAYGNSVGRTAEGMSYQVVSDLPNTINTRLLEAVVKINPGTLDQSGKSQGTNRASTPVSTNKPARTVERNEHNP